MLTCAFAAQKRKAASKSDFPYAEWVVCINSLMLFERGVNLPEELKLSKKAVQELKAIRSWAAAAALTVGPDGGAQPAGAAEGPPLPPTPPTVQVDAVVPPTRTPLAALCEFDPAILARVAQLRNGPRVSPQA